jgi:hypothetical protein
MLWRGAAAIGLVLAAGGCGGATTSGRGSLADSGADKQAPEAPAEGRADVRDAGPDATPDATPLCDDAACAAYELCHWQYATCGRPANTPGGGELYPGR